MDKNLIYSRIEELVNSRDMRFFDLAKATGISSGNMSDWKAGKSAPSLEKVMIIADYFSVPVDWIVGRDYYATKLSEDEQEIVNIYRSGDRELKVAVLNTCYEARRRIREDEARRAEEAKA